MTSTFPPENGAVSYSWLVGVPRGWLVGWSLMAFSARGTFSNESGISTIFSSGPKGQKWAQPVI